MKRAKAYFLIRDNGGRRAGDDRRQGVSRDNGVERRCGQDRRGGNDRRKTAIPRIPGSWELQVERRASFVRFYHFERRCRGKSYVKGGFIQTPFTGY